MTVLMITLVRLAITQAEAIAILLGGLNLDNGTVSGIIFRSWFGDDFHMSDVRSTQLVKFHGTRNFFIIDIDKRCTLAKHLQLAILLHNPWEMLQHLFGRPHLL